MSGKPKVGKFSKETTNDASYPPEEMDVD